MFVLTGNIRHIGAFDRLAEVRWAARDPGLANPCLLKKGELMPERARAKWAHDMFTLSIDCAGSSYHDAKKRIRRFWHDTAIMEMIGPELGYALSRQPMQPHVASVQLGEDDADGPGASAALALIGAIALALSKRGSRPHLRMVQPSASENRI
ncbi:MAG: hypothetical protein JF595_10865 [Sphingomonadales bacterium]|nr:hypothetical protein [Sphingomonadales bacterium]